MLLLSTFLLSIFITMALIPVLTRVAPRLHAVDVPDWRKVHDHPIPRTGGLGLAVGALLSALLWIQPDRFVLGYMLGACLIVLAGFLDDIKGLGYRGKFVGQIAAALITVFAAGIKIKTLGVILPENVLLPDWLAIPLVY